jgi:hypothetical protein
MFAIQNLPKEEKDSITQMLSEYRDLLPADRPDDRVLTDNNYRAFLTGTLDFMNNTAQDKAQWDRCLDILRSYERIRPIRLHDSNPILAEYL